MLSIKTRLRIKTLWIWPILDVWLQTDLYIYTFRFGFQSYFLYGWYIINRYFFFFTEPAELTNNAPTTFICCFCWCLLAFNPSSFVVVVGFDC